MKALNASPSRKPQACLHRHAPRSLHPGSKTEECHEQRCKQERRWKVAQQHAGVRGYAQQPVLHAGDAGHMRRIRKGQTRRTETRQNSSIADRTYRSTAKYGAYRISCGTQPASRDAEVEARQQEHGRRREQHHRHAGQVHRGNEIEPHQVPQFAEVVDHWRVKEEERLAGSATQIGSPARHQNPVRDVLVNLHQARKVAEAVVAPKHAAREQGDAHRQRQQDQAGGD